MKSSQYVALFVDEASLLLEQCESCLDILSHDPDLPSSRAELFRLIHTFKGMAATLIDLPYFEDMTQLSHCMESLLSPPHQPFSSESFDLLQQGTLALQTLVEQVYAPTKQPAADFSALFQRFLTYPVSLLPKTESPRTTTVELAPFDMTPALQSYLAAGLPPQHKLWEIRVELMPACMMKSVRALLVVHQLEQSAQLLAAQPSLELLREGVFDSHFALLLSSPLNATALQQEAESISEVEQVNVKSYSPSENGSMQTLELNEFELRLIEAAYSQDWHAVWVTVLVHPPMPKPPGVLAQLFNALETHGEIIRTEPMISDLDYHSELPLFRLLVLSPQNAQQLSQSLLSPAVWRTHFELRTQDYSPILHQNSSQRPSIRLHSIEHASTSTLVPPTLPNPFPESERLKNIRLQHLVRVDAEHIKRINELSNQLILIRNQVANQSQTQVEILSSLNQVSAELQSVSMRLQSMTAQHVFNRYPRMVRDLARALNKELVCRLEGGHIELNRIYVDDLSSILLHLIRNAADHGIESARERKRSGKTAQGNILLSAAYHEGQVAIRVQDDGRGIDLEALKKKAIGAGILSESEAKQMSPEETLQLIFRPGLSTSLTTTEISGRGVGMDVVRTHINQLGGALYIEATPGKGTTFTLYLPSELHEMQAVLLRDAEQIFALPLSKVTHIYSCDESPVNPTHLIRLHRNADKEAAVVLHLKGENWLGADELLGIDRLAVKELPCSTQGIQGTALLDDQRLVLCIEPDCLLPQF